MKRFSWTTTFFSILMVCLFIADLFSGSVPLSLFDIIEEGNALAQKIFYEIRLPKAIAAIGVGIALSLSGLLMQTFFRNPLAGPYVLGVSSGATLGVALFMLFPPLIGWHLSAIAVRWGCAFFAMAGAFLLFFIILAASFKVKDSVSLLVVGMLVGAAANSLVSVLQNLSDPDAVKLFVNWTLGSLSMIKWPQLGVLSIGVATGTIIIIFLARSLDAFLMGEEFAASVGVEVKKYRLGIILATVLLTGVTTAFTGPIGFVGLAVPHIARMFLGTSRHRQVIPCTALIGACIMLLSDILSQIPDNGYVLPINAVTALLGIPVVLWIFFKPQYRRR